MKAVLKNCTKRLPILLLGDFNSSIGQDMCEDSQIPIKYKKTNDNGVRLMEVVHEYDLVIENYQFRKNFQKKWSHKHPKYKTKRLLDYMLINKRWKQILTDVESRFTSYKTDHNAIMGSIDLIFKAQKKNVIKDEVSVDQHEINERLEEINQILNNETLDASILWSEIKETINNCCVKVPKSKFIYIDGLMEKEKISSGKAIEEAKILNIKKMQEAS